MERGVEDDDHRDLVAEDLLTAADRLHMTGVMQRRQRDQALDALDDLVGDQLGIAEQRAALYDAVKPIVMEELGDATCTIGELWDAVADKMPDGFTKGKLQYAVTRLWVADLERVEGKVNSYRKA